MASTKGRKSASGTSRRRSRPSPRERLLASATNLFTTEGVRVIGIDRILREADVAKASLYSLFGSKDALVVAYIERLDAAWREAWAERTKDMQDADAKILAFFDQYIEQMPAENYRGSHFLNAVCEYPKPETEAEHDIIRAVMDHRQWCKSTLTQLLTLRNGYPSETQAGHLLIFLDGGVAGSRMSRTIEPLESARTLARQMLAEPPADYSI
ncbi:MULTISPECIES: TetR/AcrR family transcriptional regulator [unclassified Corynebacterium]|uniref:TetR/AcrR family transcriptional regulator n=1 Tax=unclassified Corynebacterium TaxID=2624378 RepID=UPI0029CA5DBB|nr:MULTISPECIES: TetR/AcrR family transcriptional regulator [unclassified Corynebacterium]WPF66077.1 TetR/AcrR family transcriptional regulator [Corynebacterium sp. 22KM0430]WPF68569.1 TetR/AcrR family transcriptional regulator [Corynebacterium sp. 21KM1197]